MSVESKKRELDEPEGNESKKVKRDGEGRFDYLQEYTAKEKELSKVQIQVVGLLQKALSKPPAVTDAWDDVELGDARGLSMAIEAQIATLFDPTRNEKEYKMKVKTLSFNLGKNEELRGGVRSGTVEVEALCSMSSEQMATQKMRELRDELKKQTMMDVLVPDVPKDVTDQFKCGKCKKRKCTYYQKQTRSADEPMTTFITCVACGHQWREC